MYHIVQHANNSAWVQPTSGCLSTIFFGVVEKVARAQGLALAWLVSGRHSVAIGRST